ncbi:hypothetical protein BJ741DRAFT_654173 [Chytriomyces cf. hyalinus JEL632]|nr:hypothetical protein BJ741DRAFT_654173 [Chytriomyces cf. hyalinus JEL632]
MVVINSIWSWRPSEMILQEQFTLCWPVSQSLNHMISCNQGVESTLNYPTNAQSAYDCILGPLTGLSHLGREPWVQVMVYRSRSSSAAYLGSNLRFNYTSYVLLCFCQMLGVAGSLA